MPKMSTPKATRPRKRAVQEAAAQSAPAEQPPKRPTWKEDLAEVQRVGFWLWLCVLWIPSLTISALSGPDVSQVVLKAVQNGSMGPKEATAVWQVLVLTAPFTATVAIIGIAFLRRWFGPDDMMGVVYFGAFLLMMMTLVAQGLRIGARVEIQEVCPIRAAPFCWMIDLAYSYWQVYTPWMFVSSTAIGCFLAWAWAGKVLPRLAGE